MPAGPTGEENPPAKPEEPTIEQRVKKLETLRNWVYGAATVVVALFAFLGYEGYKGLKEATKDATEEGKKIAIEEAKNAAKEAVAKSIGEEVARELKTQQTEATAAASTAKAKLKEVEEILAKANAMFEAGPLRKLDLLLNATEANKKSTRTIVHDGSGERRILTRVPFDSTGNFTVIRVRALEVKDDGQFCESVGYARVVQRVEIDIPNQMGLVQKYPTGPNDKGATPGTLKFREIDAGKRELFFVPGAETTRTYLEVTAVARTEESLKSFMWNIE